MPLIWHIRVVIIHLSAMVTVTLQRRLSKLTISVYFSAHSGAHDSVLGTLLQSSAYWQRNDRYLVRA